MTKEAIPPSSFGLYRTISSFTNSLDRRQRRQLERQGLIEPKYRHVMREVASESSFEQNAIAAAWAARGFISCGSGLRFHGLRSFGSYPHVHVCIEEERRVRLEGATVHRRRGIVEDDIVQLRPGVFVASIPLCLLDAAFDATDFAIRSAYHDAWTRDPTLPSQVLEVLDRLGAPGRHGTERLRRTYLRYPASGNPARSLNELLLYDAIVDAGLLRPLLNYCVLRPDGKDAFIDLAWPEFGFGIEVDHTATHGEPVGKWQEDIRRGFEINDAEWFLDRVMEEHIEHMDRTIDSIRRRLARFARFQAA